MADRDQRSAPKGQTVVFTGRAGDHAGVTRRVEGDFGSVEIGQAIALSEAKLAELRSRGFRFRGARNEEVSE